MHQDTSFYMDMMNDEPEYELARELHLSREKRSKIGEILYEARRGDATKASLLEAIRAVLDIDEQHNFDVVMNYSWWRDWPWVECIAVDEETMKSCRCNSCVAIKVRQSHRERQDREFEAMLEELRERAAKPFYKDWEVPY